MCAHMRGRKTSLLPSDTQLLLKSIYSGLCFTFPRLLIPTCLLEDGHLHVCEFAIFLTAQEPAGFVNSNYHLTF